MCVINYIFVYELSRLRTLFLDSVYFSFDSSPLHVLAVFRILNLCNEIFNLLPPDDG